MQRLGGKMNDLSMKEIEELLENQNAFTSTLKSKKEMKEELDKVVELIIYLLEIKEVDLTYKKYLLSQLELNINFYLNIYK